MCGISGVFSKYEMNDSHIVKSLESIKHRGINNTVHTSFFNNKIHFYSNHLSDTQTKIDLKDSDGINSNNWLGFNRLSILDLSDKGMQPFYDKETQVSFAMNGEVYNFRELHNEFLQGVDLISSCDAEVVFQLYLKLGKSFVNHLRGMFTIVIINYKNKKAHIWRDRFGLKPFYYFLDNEKLIFSSEIKGIFSAGLVKREIDYKQLAYSFYLNTCFSPHTIYQDIYSLEPASKLSIDLETLKLEKQIYWQLKYEPSQKNISKQEFLEDIKQVSQLTSISDVKQAIMLSGGLDSGLLAYQFSKNNIDIDAITIYNDQTEDQNELPFAISNAENAHLELKSFKIDNNVDIDTIKEYCLAEEEPNISPEPAYFLAKKANKDNYFVLQNALGLDELFYGYGYYYQTKRLQKLYPFLLKSMKHFIKGMKRYKYEDITTLGLEAIPFVSRSIISWKEIKLIFKQYNSDSWEHPAKALLNKIKKQNPNFSKMPLLKKVSYLDFYFYIGSHHSFRSDQSSMKFGIEMRFPYLDHHFVQKYFNSTKLDQDLTLKNNKPFLRKNVQDILPKDVLKMEKKGFSIPTKKWLEDISLDTYLPELQFYYSNYKSWANTPSKKWWAISSVLLLNRLK